MWKKAGRSSTRHVEASQGDGEPPRVGVLLLREKLGMHFLAPIFPILQQQSGSNISRPLHKMGLQWAPGGEMVVAEMSSKLGDHFCSARTTYGNTTGRCGAHFSSGSIPTRQKHPHRPDATHLSLHACPREWNLPASQRTIAGSDVLSPRFRDSVRFLGSSQR